MDGTTSALREVERTSKKWLKLCETTVKLCSANTAERNRSISASLRENSHQKKKQKKKKKKNPSARKSSSCRERVVDGDNGDGAI